MLSASQRFFCLLFADLIFLVHLALVLLVAVGWLVPGLYPVFATTLAVVLLADIFVGNCPLTSLEFNLRRKLNPGKIYGNSCITHYLQVWLRRPSPTPRLDGPKTFLQKHSFKSLLLGLFVVATLFRFVIFSS
mgnify:FL=1